jgi:chemotaxis protein MotB
MLHRRLTLLAAGALALAVAGCAGFGTPPQLSNDADQLRNALAGQPVVVVVQGNVLTITSSADAMFPSGGWQIPPQAPVLNKMLPVLASLKSTRIVVNGYTDNTPVGQLLKAQGVADNLDLSAKRAASVVTYLTARGVNPNLISAQGFGETHPVATNDTPEGRARNRRVDITLTGDGT